MLHESIVTGAFGYIGKYITRRLLAEGRRVRTLTAHPNRPNPFGDQVSVAPFNFHKPDDLVASMRGATTLYNTYWIRFAHGSVSFEIAVEHSRTLIGAAERAGVGRIVHVSITNPSAESHLPYFRGKAAVEAIIGASGLSHAIIRPTVVFGVEDILINNIAWLLRRFPVFGVPGSGDYRLQPVFVEDVAELAVDAGRQEGGTTVDAVGPEVYTFRELVRLIAGAISSRAKIVSLPRWSVLLISKLMGPLVGDVILTRDEAEGLMSNLLVSDASPTGKTSFRDWVDENAHALGAAYASELDRHYR